MPKLIIKFEAAVIKEVPKITSVTTIGRKTDNDIVIDHPAVSGHHCRILLQGDTYFVEDLNSTNGTLLNEKKIIKAGVHDQDVIGIAKHRVIFLQDSPSQSPAKAPAAVPAQATAQAPQPAPKPSAEVLQPEMAEPPLPKKKFDKIGGLRITEGAVDQNLDFLLTDNSTYIGKSERVNIKIKGGLMAPEVAAMVSRKVDGYVLVAIKEGYPKVNGISVQKDRPLSEGDTIEVGGTKMQFYLKSA